MAKFRDNQRVRVAKNPKDPKESPQFIGGMNEFKGKIVTIHHHNGTNYRIKEDDERYSWAERWFEAIVAEVIEVVDDTITLFRNNGRLFNSERRVLIADFVDKMKSRKIKESNMSTPVLPPNTKYYARDKETEVCVVEQFPQTRIVRWPGAGKKKKNVPIEYSLAFPYVIFVCVFVGGKLVMIEGETPKCFYRPAQITSPKDMLYHTNLINVSSEKSGLFLGVRLGNQGGVREQIGELIRCFWGNALKDGSNGGSDFDFSKKVSASLASAGVWQEESSLNPLFPLKLPWRSGQTVQGAALDSLREFSGLETGQEKIQHVKQLVEIAKELPEV